MKNIHGGPAVNPCTQGPEFGATPLCVCVRVRACVRVYVCVYMCRGVALWALGTRIHRGAPMNVLHRGRGFNPFRLGTHCCALTIEK